MLQAYNPLTGDACLLCLHCDDGMASVLGMLQVFCPLQALL